MRPPLGSEHGQRICGVRPNACGSYFDTGWHVYGEDETEIPFAINQQRVSDYINLMLEAGFVLERVEEPDSRQRYPYDPWYGLWSCTPQLMQYLPPTIIFKARRGHGKLSGS